MMQPSESTTGASLLKPYLSLVAPVYNEEEGIEAFIEEADAELRKLGKPFEIICANDGSTDQTPKLLTQLRTRFPALRIVHLKPNAGQSGAFEAGIRFAQGEVIALIDADMQNDPADIAKMLAIYEGPQKPTCVAGRRVNRKDNWLRRISSKIANAVRIWLTKDPIQDTGCSLKLFKASVLKKAKIFKGMHRFLTTLIRMEGGTVIEVDVNHRPRTLGTPKYGLGLGRTFVALRDAFAVRWMKSRHLRYEVHEE